MESSKHFDGQQIAGVHRLTQDKVGMHWFLLYNSMHHHGSVSQCNLSLREQADMFLDNMISPSF